MTTPRTAYRLGVVTALGAALFLLFGIGALGIIGAGGRPDLLYVAALAVGVVGTVLARLRPGGMAYALAATALATVLAGLLALGAGLHEVPGASVVEIIGLTGMYAGLFTVAAWFFRRSSRHTDRSS
jgi:hypothetical protein